MTLDVVLCESEEIWEFLTKSALCLFILHISKFTEQSPFLFSHWKLYQCLFFYFFVFLDFFFSSATLKQN